MGVYTAARLDALSAKRRGCRGQALKEEAGSNDEQQADHGPELRFLVDHFRKLADHLGRSLEDTDWNRRREIIRSLIERIEIGRPGLAIIFRTPYSIAVPKDNPIVLTLSRE